MAVRTRIAPSPTGSPHLGTAYVGLMNRVFADATGGQFVLRIEDTDQARSSAESESAITGALNWLGIEWDEGPDVGGPSGPYRQSDRLSLYRQHATDLVAAGEAFYCFCSPERLEAVRREQISRKETPRYDGACLNLTQSEVSARLEAGEPHVVRLKVPQEGNCSFQDHLRGEIQVAWQQVDMQVLLKSDGFPTYHLAACVDDHLMRISHLIRGEEWISSVPKHQLLARAFGWQTPVYVHLPLIRNPDGSKLSKRRNPTSVDYYRRIGILPEALLNYLATLGWSMPDESELFDLDQMRESFSLDRLRTGAPVFDQVKLRAFNGKYLRKMDADKFLRRYLSWADESGASKRIAALVQDRSEAFSDIAPQIDYLIGNRSQVCQASFEHKSLDIDAQLRVLAFAAWTLEALQAWHSDAIHAACKHCADVMQVRFRDFVSPLFVATSGRSVSLPLFDSMHILGKDVTLVRIRDAIECLGGLSKKRTKALQREFDALGAGP